MAYSPLSRWTAWLSGCFGRRRHVSGNPSSLAADLDRSAPIAAWLHVRSWLALLRHIVLTQDAHPKKSDTRYKSGRKRDSCE